MTKYRGSINEKHLMFNSFHSRNATKRGKRLKTKERESVQREDKAVSDSLGQYVSVCVFMLGLRDSKAFGVSHAVSVCFAKIQEYFSAHLHISKLYIYVYTSTT